MSGSARKLNFMISEKIAQELERIIPPGQRSKVVNEALQKELLTIRRKRVAEKMRSLREKSPALKTSEIVGIVRREREVSCY